MFLFVVLDHMDEHGHHGFTCTEGAGVGCQSERPLSNLALIQDCRPLRKALELDDLTEK